MPNTTVVSLLMDFPQDTLLRRSDHQITIGPISPPDAMTRHAVSQPAEVSIPPPASSATPMAHDPAADKPKPTVECIAIVAPRYSGTALKVMPDVSAPESAGMATA